MEIIIGLIKRFRSVWRLKVLNRLYLILFRNRYVFDGLIEDSTSSKPIKYLEGIKKLLDF